MPGEVYQLTESEDFVTWNPIGSPIDGTLGAISVPIEKFPASARFFRLIIDQPDPLSGDRNGGDF
jgi:hypothetical protein